MSDNFGFSEKYLTSDGKELIDASCVREALGIGEDYNADILGEIKRLKEERERYKSNCDYFAGIAEDKLCDRNKLELELREALGTVDEYADIPGLVRKLKKERDELKERCGKLEDRLRTYRFIANGTYGDSCGYSGEKDLAFLCDVISYSWSFGAIDTPFPNNSIRVELKLTPTANYKGTFDLEELKKYIQAYGREKKLGVIESVDYQNAKAARAELAYLYKQVLGKEKLDRDLSPHEVMKAILDEYDKREDFIRVLSCSLGFGKPVVNQDNIDQKEKDILERIESLKSGVWPCENSSTFAEHLRKEFPKFCEKYNIVPLTNASIHDWLQYIFDVLSEWRGKYDSEWNRAEELIKDKRAVEDSLAELRAKVREIYRSVVDDEWDESLSYTSALNDINEEYKRVVHNFEERTADWRKAQQELDRYRLAVGSLLGIPKGSRDDINAIERSFNLTNKKYVSLKEFRNNVCEILDIPSSMADDQERILKEIHDFADCYYELRDFRADVCEVLGIDADELFGSPQQNDKYILEQVEKLKGNGCDAEKEFLDAVKKRIGVSADCSDHKYMLRCLDIKLDHSSLSAFTDSVYEELGLNRYGYTLTDAANELKTILRSNARFRSDVCTALCLGGETSDEDILKRVCMTRECHDALCKDYTELRKAIWEAMDRKPETLPEETARLVGEVRMLQLNYKSLLDLLVNYGPAQKILSDISEFRKWAIEELKRYEIVVSDLEHPERIDVTGSDIFRKLLKRYDWAYGMYEEQYRLRQCWHTRYESEHERANGEHKRAEKLRSEGEALKKKVEFLEESSNTQWNEVVALQAFKNECRKLKEEKTKVISALGQDIWDDCLK